jgi:hypothetical protein
MKTKFTLVLISAFVCFSVTVQSFGQERDDDFYQPWVDYRDGEISMAFDQTPIRFALYAFQARTGLQIVIPSNTESKVVNLRLEGQPLESALQSLISNIGYKNFALMYDDAGRPNRAVVLETLVEAPRSARTQRIETAQAQLPPEERDRLLRDLQRWSELSSEERGRIEDRLKSLPASVDRDQLVAEYGRQVLGLTQEVIAAIN